MLFADTTLKEMVSLFTIISESLKNGHKFQTNKNKDLASNHSLLYADSKNMWFLYKENKQGRIFLLSE